MAKVSLTLQNHKLICQNLRMNAKIIVGVALIFSICMSMISCANFNGSKSVSIEGHWISGQCYSYFISDDRTYLMDDRSIPKEVVSFMGKQPCRPDPYTKGGEASAVFMSIDCVIRTDLQLYPKGYRWICVERVNSFHSAKSDFWLKPHPLPY